MKKKNILLVSTALLALCGCNGKGNGNSNASTSNGGEPTSNTSSFTSSVGDTSSIESISSESSSVASTEISTADAMELFEEALKKDYSNLSLMSYQQYNDGEVSELDYEYMDDGYTVDYAYSLREAGMDEEYCYTYYYDDNGTSYTYWEADKNIQNSKGGWLNKGYHNADLSIWNAYFYLPKLLANVTLNDVAYQQGLYYIKDIAKVESLNYEAFGYAWYNDIIDICFVLDDNGYIGKIYGFCDDSSAEPKNYVEISLFDIGTTILPNMDRIVGFSEQNKTTYWQYKGWPNDYVDAYYNSIEIALAPNQDLVSDASHDVVIDLDKSFKVNLSLSPSAFEDWEMLSEENSIVTWHFDEAKLEQKSSGVEKQIMFRAIAPGEAEVYATIKGKGGVELESEHIKVKVNEAAIQDKTDVVYDFAWGEIDENYKVTAQNKTESKALYEITAGPGVKLLSGKNSDLFNKDEQYLVIDPLSQDIMNSPLDPGVFFDFGEQQVSKISFNYGLFYANHKSYLNKLKSVKIRTSNDGVTYNEIDITQEVKENISSDFVKLLEKEFEPASKVELVVNGYSIGNGLAIAFDSVCFMANDKCNDYVAPDERVEVESITVSPSTVEMNVGESTTLVGSVLPQNATDKTLTWSVKEGDAISIDANGKVEALKVGQAIVTATSADGKVVSNDVMITVNEAPSFANYLNCSYKEDGGDWLVEILSNTSARISNGIYSVEATISDFKNDVYTLTNENGEGFSLSWTNSRVDITKIKYLRNGALSEDGGTKYCYLRVFMEDFTVKVGNLTPNNEGKYEVLVGDNVYLSLLNALPNEANVKEVTYSSSDTSKAVIVEPDEESVVQEVSFIAAGEVTITVTDAHNPSLSKDIVFIISARTYPSDSNWTLQSDKEVMEVGETANLTTEFDASINTDTTVTYSVDDSEIASINSRGVLTAKKEGTVVVTATVNTENGTSEKTVTITINPSAQGAVPAEVRGNWSGCDDNATSFTFTVNEEGATFEFVDYDGVNHNYTFTYVGIVNGEYLFQCNEVETVQVSLYLSSSTSTTASFTLIDPNSSIMDYYVFAIFGEYLEITK